MQAPIAGAQPIVVAAKQTDAVAGFKPGASGRSAIAIGRVVAYGIVVAGGLFIGVFVGLIASLATGLIAISC